VAQALLGWQVVAAVAAAALRLRLPLPLLLLLLLLLPPHLAAMPCHPLPRPSRWRLALASTSCTASPF